MPEETQKQILTPRWYPLKAQTEQMRLLHSPARFKVVPAGRRSGKTERAKRHLIRTALSEIEWPDARYFAGAPTRDQAKRIYWDDLLRFSPKWAIEAVSISELTIKYITGASISVVGLDKPERIEGSPWNGGVLDEFANMKPNAWSANVRPALSDRKGWCWLIGVPEGRNHYYDLYEYAVHGEHGGEWDGFTWKSAEILPPEEIAAAKREMDELTYQQEYEASFLNFQGRAYYSFDGTLNSARLEYNPRLPLIFMFDFNVSPGVACVAQEQDGKTCFIGEVYIPSNSNTVVVCNRLIKDWGREGAGHSGMVYCYGDATGGNSGSAKLHGSDWDIINRELRKEWPTQLRVDVQSQNPPERSRVNAVNTRCKTADGVINLLVDPNKAKRLKKDFEGVRVIAGGSGEIDKKSDPSLSHISDAAGYYIWRKFPVVGQSQTSRNIVI